MMNDYYNDDDINELITDELLDEMADGLDIELTKVVHITFNNGMEMIGEFFMDEPSAKNGERIFINPLRIDRELFRDEEGNFVTQENFNDWSPSTQPRIISIRDNSILATSVPTEASLKTYMVHLWTKYFPEDSLEQPSEEAAKSLSKDNVIDINHILQSRKSIKTIL